MNGSPGPRDDRPAVTATRRFGRGMKIAVAAVATLASLVLVEVALTVLDVEPVRGGSSWFAGGNHPRFLFEPDPRAGYRLRPGFVGREVALTGEFDVAVAIDQRGMRERDRPAAAAPAVLAIGDSMTFGEGVEAGETFSALLEESTGYPIWNAGVPGYNTRQMMLRMQQLLEIARPRLVLIGLMPTWDAARFDDPFVYQEGFIVASGWVDRLHLISGNLWSESIHLPVIGPLSAQAKARSRLVRLTVPGLRRALHLPGSRRRSPGARSVAANDWRGVDASARQLSLAASSAAASGATVLAVLFESRGKRSIAIRERLEAKLAEQGLETVVLDRVMKGAHWKSLRHPEDGHWNRAGHREVAATLAPLIEARLGTRSLPTPPPPETSVPAAPGASD